MSLVVLFAVAGCEQQKKDFGPDQAATGAADRIAELQEALDRCEQDRAAAEDRALALQTEVDRLKAEAAKAQPGQGWTSVPGGSMISIEGTVLFDSGKKQLKSGAGTVLDRVADTILSKYPEHDIYVFGHTDNEPIQVSGWKDNYELSCQRALTVLRYLRSQGVGTDIAACGWGEDRPVTDNKTPEGRRRNRRVEIFVMARR
jgi:chemotaxis protein MotB